MLRDLHAYAANLVVWANGLSGLWGLGYALTRKQPGRGFDIAKFTSLGIALVQVSLGLVLYGQGQNPGSIHMFYGMVILFTLAFVYIYRTQFEKRPGLAWGLVLLVVMGLGIRGWTNFGESFG